MRRLFLPLVLVFVLIPSPAFAGEHTECRDISSRHGTSHVCYHTEWTQSTGNDLVIQWTRLCASPAPGLEAIYDIHETRLEVVSGTVRDTANAGRQPDLCWRNDENTRINSGFGQVSVRFTLDWALAFDDSSAINYNIS